MNFPLHLASGSQSRISLLLNAGVFFTHGAVRFDEHTLKASLRSAQVLPADIALALARGKAEAAHADGLVLGCDQILAVGGELLTKATDRNEARETLRKLQGRSHTLYAAAVIYRNGREIWKNVSSATLTMRPMNRDQIERYLDQTWPDVAGSVGCYHLEGIGVRLFTSIEGDFFTVLGLPLLPILAFLRAEGGLDQ